MASNSVFRWLWSILGLCALLFLENPARAWNEVIIKSDHITVDVAADGTAVVSHEILLRVRGRGRKAFVVSGVDSDRVPLPGATLTIAKSGRAAGLPMPLTTRAEGADLHLAIEGTRGLISAHYLLQFSYSTNLMARGLIEFSGDFANLRWVGPRFNDGIDSVRTLFRVPQAELEPRLPEADTLTTGVGLVEEYDGVFLSNYRRAGDKDELEVVRPHVAKGEPVVWRLRFDARALGARPVVAGESKASPPPPFLPKKKDRSSLGLAIAFGAGLLYSFLVFRKRAHLEAAAQSTGSEVVALLELPGWLRAGFAGLFYAAAVALGLLSSWMLAAGVGVAIAMLLASFGALREPLSSRRGPGSWQVLSPKKAFARPRIFDRQGGAWLDARRPLGASVLLTSLVLVALFAYSRFRVSQNQGVLMAIAGVGLVPLFLSSPSRVSTQVSRMRTGLEYYYKRLSKKALQATVSIRGRMPESGAPCDELRLLITPEPAPRGLSSIELALEYQVGFAATLELPVLLLRAREDSPAIAALPRTLSWTRGRTPDERVAILRPRVPSRGGTLSLIRELVERLSQMTSRAHQGPNDAAFRPRSAKNSSGKPMATRKPGTASLPSQPM